MRTVNPDNTYNGLTFPQWRALLNLAQSLCVVAAYLGNPTLISRAEALRAKVKLSYHG